MPEPCRNDTIRGSAIFLQIFSGLPPSDVAELPGVHGGQFTALEGQILLKNNALIAKKHSYALEIRIDLLHLVGSGVGGDFHWTDCCLISGLEQQTQVLYPLLSMQFS